MVLQTITTAPSPNKVPPTASLGHLYQPQQQKQRTKTITETEEDSEDKEHDSRFTFTLHLVRHAETEANRAGIVLGQSDSPLTDKGISQAKAAHTAYGTHNPNGQFYWKIFSSDLGRCVSTARLILGMTSESLDDGAGQENEENYVIFFQDKRLRERAKGIREGHSKHLSYEQVMEEIQHGRKTAVCDDNMATIFESDSPMLLESELQVMERFQDWLDETIRDAYKHYCECQCQSGGGGGDGSYHVLVISHSGLIRIVLERFLHLGKQIPANASREGECQHTKVSRLVIPNTSKTVIQFTKPKRWNFSADCKSHGLFDHEMNNTDNRDLGHKYASWNATLLDYTNVSHFGE